MYNQEVVSSTPGQLTIKWLRLGVYGQVNHFGITNTKVNSAFHSSRICKSSAGLFGKG